MVFIDEKSQFTGREMTYRASGTILVAVAVAVAVFFT